MVSVLAVLDNQVASPLQYRPDRHAIRVKTRKFVIKHPPIVWVIHTRNVARSRVRSDKRSGYYKPPNATTMEKVNTILHHI